MNVIIKLNWTIIQLFLKKVNKTEQLIENSKQMLIKNEQQMTISKIKFSKM